MPYAHYTSNKIQGREKMAFSGAKIFTHAKGTEPTNSLSACQVCRECEFVENGSL